MSTKIRSAQVLAQSKGKQSTHTQKAISAAAKELGAMGGREGGPARANALSDEQRAEIAIHAANKRWGNSCNCSYCAGDGDS